MADKKLFLLDAYALIYRAHFAFIKNPRINSKGLNTSAVFGFTNSLLDVLNNESPTHIGIVFDTGAPTFRSDIYEEYKANRDEQPEDIAIAIPYLKKLAEGFRVYMMTPDKDYSQCVEEDIFIYKPGRMGKPSEIWDVEKVKEKFDIEDPKQVVDIQGLTGDSVDNIPGVPGIGPKTASKLIAEFKSLEKLLDSTEQLKGKQKERLEEHAEVARLSKELATLKVDVPIAFEADKLRPIERYLATTHFPIESIETSPLARAIRYAAVESTEPDIPVNLVFGEQLTLDRIALPAGSSFAADEVIPVTLVWQPIAEIPDDYNVSVQVATSDGFPIAQRDGQPQGTFGAFSQWKTGTTYLDNHGIALPEDAAPGEYIIQVIIYRWQDGQRLTVGEGDIARIATIEVR